MFPENILEARDIVRNTGPNQILTIVNNQPQKNSKHLTFFLILPQINKRQCAADFGQTSLG